MHCSFLLLHHVRKWERMVIVNEIVQWWGHQKDLASFPFAVLDLDMNPFRIQFLTHPVWIWLPRIEPTHELSFSGEILIFLKHVQEDLQRDANKGREIVQINWGRCRFNPLYDEVFHCWVHVALNDAWNPTHLGAFAGDPQSAQCLLYESLCKYLRQCSINNRVLT